MTASAAPSRFAHLARRSRRRALTLSLVLHAALLAVALSAALRGGSAVSAPVAVPADDANRAPVPQLEMMALAPEQPAPGVPTGLDPEVAKARLRLGVRDHAERSAQDLQAELAKLTEQAASISDASLDAIGAHLGAKPGEYRVRTEYIDELNPNADLTASIIVAAQAEGAPDDPVLRLTTCDREGDRFTFTLQGDAAQPLLEAQPAFDGEPLLGAPAGFELKDAIIADIRLARSEQGPPAKRAKEVTLEDPQGRRVVLRLTGTKAEPFRLEMMRFMQRRMGHKVDETTLHTQTFDMNSATMMPPRPEDFWEEDGEPVARQVLLDRHGERMIMILRGEQARQHREQTQSLDNPVLRNLYERTLMHLLPGMREEGQPKAPSGPAAEK